MLPAFQTYLNRIHPDLTGKNILVACSGGLDSRVLAHLLSEMKFGMALAHCNFSLRGEESDQDEKFVKQLAKEYGVPFFAKRFDTASYAGTHGLSIQMAARELRYAWFDALLKNEDYDVVATAHHADDDLETFFINLSRGTGLRGLRGIPPTNQNVVRPLLEFSRAQILKYAKGTGLYWREDSSNQKTKYLRNRIRQQLIPEFKKLGENAITGFRNTQEYAERGSLLIEDYVQLVRRLVAVETEEGLALDIAKLRDLPNTPALLYELLRPFGFTDLESIHDLLEAQTGKQVTAPQYRIIKNRDTLLITALSVGENNEAVTIPEGAVRVETPIGLTFGKADRFQITNDHTIFVDAERLQYPLTLRKWENGDCFRPYGMKGKKKLSKFFKDEKLSLVAKEKSWLLCSGDEIVWVVGYRMDDRYKVTKETKHITRIDYTPA